MTFYVCSLDTFFSFLKKVSNFLVLLTNLKKKFESKLKPKWIFLFCRPLFWCSNASHRIIKSNNKNNTNNLFLFFLFNYHHLTGFLEGKKFDAVFIILPLMFNQHNFWFSIMISNGRFNFKGSFIKCI